MLRALVLALAACGAPIRSAGPPPTAQPEEVGPFDQRNSALRDELGLLIAPTVAEYSGLKGDFTFRIRVPYKDIVEAKARELEGTWHVEIRVTSERDKERIDTVYVKPLKNQRSAERAAELVLTLRDHHKRG